MQLWCFPMRARCSEAAGSPFEQLAHRLVALLTRRQRSSSRLHL
jgi:hypothetical protein